MKGSSQNPFAPTNELVAGMLALQAGFRVLEPYVVHWKNDLYFGRAYLDHVVEITGINDHAFSSTNYGQVFQFPEQENDFETFIRRKAERPVDSKFRELGFEINQSDHEFEAILNSEPIARPLSS